MWKWTDSDNINVIILDSHSLEDHILNYRFEDEISRVRVCKVDKFRSPLEVGYHIQTGFYRYFDISSLLNYIMTEYHCASYSIIAISSDIIFLKEMMQNHIGTIFVGNINTESLKFVPDFTVHNERKLQRILNQTNLGYIAEVMTSGFKDKHKSLLSSSSHIILNNGEKKIVDLYFGGRYYSYYHHYFDDDPLSTVLIQFKEHYLKIVDSYYDKVIQFISHTQNIDLLTYVPLKPADIEDKKFDRFQSLKLEMSKELGIKLQQIIKCKKDFTQKGKDMNTRQQNVKGAYELLENVTNKNIVILDDLYTSGSTIKEIAKIFYEKGAKKVTAILLAVNQMTESTSTQYHQLTCSYCGSSMSLKVKKTDGKLFFGCDNYQLHREKNTSLNLKEGLRLLKHKNKLDIISMVDLDDEY